MLKLYRVIYPESWSQLWLLTEWLIVIKWARYESNGYGGKITKHRTKPLHIRHLLPWEFKCRKIVRPYKASDYSTSVCLSEFDEVLVKHKTRQTYNAGTHGNQSMLELIIAYWLRVGRNPRYVSYALYHTRFQTRLLKSIRLITNGFLKLYSVCETSTLSTLSTRSQYIV